MNRRHLIKCIFPVVLLLLFSQLVVSDSWRSLPVFLYLLEFAQTHVHCVGDAIQPSHALSSPSPPAFNLSQLQGLFQWDCSLHHVAKVLELQYWSVSSSNEYLGLISFRIDWFDLAVQGTLKNLLQHHSLKASVLQQSAFFLVQLSRPYMTNRKTIVFTRWTFVSKVMASKLTICLLVF